MAYVFLYESEKKIKACEVSEILIGLFYFVSPLHLITQFITQSVPFTTPFSRDKEEEILQMKAKWKNKNLPKKDLLFIIGDWNAKVGSQDIPEVTGKFGLGSTKLKQGKG